MSVNEIFVHQNFLLNALQQAEQRRGFCAPNPAVGCVVVKDNQVIAVGYHWAAGYPHAEVDALAKLGQEAVGAILYVTLEPCCHFGRTPPCTQLIIQRGIKAVYYAARDPNPLVAGKGQCKLLDAGIHCQQISVPKIDDFYQSYFYWLKTRRPWVTAKLAMSLDGKIASESGKPIAITGPELQRYTHQWRRHSDAILTTINTVINDDPQLNVRLENEPIAKPVYVLDTHLRFPKQAKLLQTTSKLTIFYAATADAKQLAELEKLEIRCVKLAGDERGLSLSAVIQAIGADGIHDLWVEAGGKCFQSLIDAELLQRALIYLGGKFLGSNALAAFTGNYHGIHKASKVEWKIFGIDAVCQLDWKE